MAGTLSTGNKDNIALSCADVVALQEEKLIDAIVLEGRDLDDSSNGAGEALLNHEVLLALDLSQRKRDRSMKLIHELAGHMRCVIGWENCGSPYLLPTGGRAGPFGLCP